VTPALEIEPRPGGPGSLVEEAQRRHATGGGLLDVCELLLAQHGALERCVSTEPRRQEDQEADLRFLFPGREWLQSRAGEELLGALRAHPLIADARRRRSAIAVRFEDAALTGLERRLSAGELAGMGTSDLLAGSRFTVGFVGPNTNKALHVGHLRNVVLGHALASAMSAAGAEVQRHNLVGDIGRRVCEAMVGYTARHAGEDPRDGGLAPDRFVELCCRDFPTEGVPEPEAQDGDPNAEERESRGDAADLVMRRWLDGEAAERQLGTRVRDWAMAGHRRTLARLGIRMDCQDFESDGIQRALGLIEEGVAAGLFEREASGGVVYRTGRSEYATMVLLRADGAPTEYARLLGVYRRLDDKLPPGALYIEVVGLEWQPVMAVQAELLTRILGRPSERRYTWAFHGAITVGGEKMGSSTGKVLWIDDLLDEVAACAGVAALRELSGGTVGREELAEIVIRGSFLCASTLHPLPFARERLVAERAGAGWTIAEAWCRAQRPSEPRAGAPIARTAVVQSQLYRGALRRAAEAHDAAGLAAYLLGLAEAYLAAPEPGPAAGAVLGRVLASMGFPTAPRAVEQSETAGARKLDWGRRRA
jgi:tRNA synthetases class I (R)